MFNAFRKLREAVEAWTADIHEARRRFRAATGLDQDDPLELPAGETEQEPPRVLAGNGRTTGRRKGAGR